MAEPQYQSYFDYPASQLGPMASQYYRDDPKLLGIHLARYKFVSKMLAGKKKVAEVGSGDGWFSRVVEKEVKELHLYDFDKRFIDSIYSNGGKKAYVHDILGGGLEYGNYDAIYSLDCFEHIEPKNENLYLKNICKSLDVDGVFICGIPSLESQQYASPASKKGHCNCKTGSDFQNLLNKYFKQTFMFTMHDENIGCNFQPMAHYLIGVSCGVR